MKLVNILKVSILVTSFVACRSDDDGAAPSDNGLNFEVPATYVFERNGESTVSFGGQTTRLEQGAEILSDLKTFGTTEATIDRKYADGTGFTDATLNGSKNIRDKVVENFVKSKREPIVDFFDLLIQDQVDTFLGKYADKASVPVASAGVSGILGGKRLVNEKGLEYDQAFNKGLIGALTLDQIINDYLSLTESPDIQQANTAGTLDGSDNYTQAEHFWDEAYGYLYGASNEDVLDNPNSVHLVKDNVTDKFLYKYVQRVNSDSDFAGIANEIFQAFKTGRAAIVAKDYAESKKQANIIREKLSEVIAIRAVYYLQQGKNGVKNGALVDNGDAFHDLSEGYGFIYSLQFTQDPSTEKPYFSKSEVDGFIAKLDAGNGFWEFTANQSVLDDLSNDIAAKFDFTVDQAAE